MHLLMSGYGRRPEVSTFNPRYTCITGSLCLAVVAVPHCTATYSHSMPPRVSFSAGFDSYAHDQGSDGTCYAHTAATLTINALRRMCPGAQDNIPDRGDVLRQTIRRFGRDGADTEEALTWAVRTYVEPARRLLQHDGGLEDGRAEVRRVSADEVDDIVRVEEAKVAMCFRLSPEQFDQLTRFFERNPMNILSAQDLGSAEAPPTEGHAVVIEDLEDYEHGGL